MIEKIDDDGYLFTCDQCGSEYLSPFFDFHEALEDAKEEGWVFRKIKGAWVCFDNSLCLAEYIKTL